MNQLCLKPFLKKMIFVVKELEFGFYFLIRIVTLKSKTANCALCALDQYTPSTNALAREED